MAQNFCGWWRMISTAIGAVSGFTMFLLFLIYWQNYTASVWALATGVFASVGFQLSYMHFSNVLERWHNVATLNGVTLLGVMGSLAGMAGLLWYMFTAFYFHIPLLPMGSSALITAVWAGLMLKYSCFLVFTSRAFIRSLTRERQSLITA